MKDFYKKHYKKLIVFGLIKKLFLVYLLSHSSLFASGTYSGIYFDDYEENATLYFVNYYNQTDINNVIKNSTTSKNIVDYRIDGLFTSISELDSVSGVGNKKLHYLKQQSHLIDWNTYTDKFGMTLHQTNFIYALTGSLIGAMFLFFMIYAIVRR